MNQEYLDENVSARVQLEVADTLMQVHYVEQTETDDHIMRSASNNVFTAMNEQATVVVQDNSTLLSDAPQIRAGLAPNRRSVHTVL
ncbi:hypothetical protein FRB91_004010 [Serendipita sp. 411]|nr:hypothetical protein FRB91_004010 [Serendipita sp. 411]